MEENKHKVLLTVIGAGTLLIALAGATFAYFSATSTTTVQQVTTSSMDLTVAADGDATHVTNIKPTTWSATVTDNVSNTDIAKIPFNVTSKSTAAGTYTIKMKADNGLALKTVGKDPLNNDVDLTHGGTDGSSLSQVKYKLYSFNGTTYTAVPTTGTGDFAAPTADKTIVDGATISSTLNDRYVLFVYIENATDKTQDQLQGLDFNISVTGSAQQS